MRLRERCLRPGAIADSNSPVRPLRSYLGVIFISFRGPQALNDKEEYAGGVIYECGGTRVFIDSSRVRIPLSASHHRLVAALITRASC